MSSITVKYLVYYCSYSIHKNGNKTSFSTAEIAAIDEIWSRVAEDFAPFNLNVTTVAPPVITDRVAARVAIGGSYSDWYGRSAGGVSFVGGFSTGASNVAYVFANTLSNGNPRYVGRCPCLRDGRYSYHDTPQEDGKISQPSFSSLIGIYS